MKEGLAPIVIFGYNRPDKLKNLLDSLERNSEFNKSDIFFFIDKHKPESSKSENREVIQIAESLKTAKSVNIQISDKNIGLKQNILLGINTIFETYDKAIFLEDDLIVGPYFLDFMNNSLDIYRSKKHIFHISGYNYPFYRKESKSSYVSRYMNCWGWATWKDRWEINNNFTANTISTLDKKRRFLFNVYGLEKDFEDQLKRNENKTLSSWAIFWSQFIFLSKGYCLNPVTSLVVNTGVDGTGTNQGKTSLYVSEINLNKINKFPKKYKFRLIDKLEVTIFYLKKYLSKKISYK